MQAEREGGRDRKNGGKGMREGSGHNSLKNFSGAAAGYISV